MPDPTSCARSGRVHEGARKGERQSAASGRGSADTGMDVIRSGIVLGRAARFRPLLVELSVNSPGIVRDR